MTVSVGMVVADIKTYGAYFHYYPSSETQWM
jgi:hypothetical protein